MKREKNRMTQIMEYLMAGGLTLIALYLATIVYLIFSGAGSKLTNKGDWDRAKNEAAMSYFGTTKIGLVQKLWLNIVALKYVKQNWKSFNSL